MEQSPPVVKLQFKDQQPPPSSSPSGMKTVPHPPPGFFYKTIPPPPGYLQKIASENAATNNAATNNNTAAAGDANNQSSGMAINHREFVSPQLLPIVNNIQPSSKKFRNYIEHLGNLNCGTLYPSFYLLGNDTLNNLSTNVFKHYDSEVEGRASHMYMVKNDESLKHVRGNFHQLQYLMANFKQVDQDQEFDRKNVLDKIVNADPLKPFFNLDNFKNFYEDKDVRKMILNNFRENEDYKESRWLFEKVSIMNFGATSMMNMLEKISECEEKQKRIAQVTANSNHLPIYRKIDLAFHEEANCGYNGSFFFNQNILQDEKISEKSIKEKYENFSYETDIKMDMPLMDLPLQKIPLLMEKVKEVFRLKRLYFTSIRNYHSYFHNKRMEFSYILTNLYNSFKIYNDNILNNLLIDTFKMNHPKTLISFKNEIFRNFRDVYGWIHLLVDRIDVRFIDNVFCVKFLECLIEITGILTSLNVMFEEIINFHISRMLKIFRELTIPYSWTEKNILSNYEDDIEKRKAEMFDDSINFWMKINQTIMPVIALYNQTFSKFLLMSYNYELFNYKEGKKISALDASMKIHHDKFNKMMIKCHPQYSETMQDGLINCIDVLSANSRFAELVEWYAKNITIYEFSIMFNPILTAREYNLQPSVTINDRVEMFRRGMTRSYGENICQFYESVQRECPGIARMIFFKIFETPKYKSLGCHTRFVRDETKEKLSQVYLTLKDFKILTE